MTSIQQVLYNHQDKKYAEFSAKLIPTLPRESFIGVRAPEYKKIIKEISILPSEEINSFMNSLPHEFHEENCLHIALLNKIKDFEDCLAKTEAFLPFINNWAVSDGLNPACFGKNHDKLIVKCNEWLASDLPFTKRVAMLCIMKHFLTTDFKSEYLEWVAKIRSEEYYVNMMIAWLFAEALSKQWDCAILFIEQKKLDKWTHNKAIQKAKESFKITSDQKEYLVTLKIK